VFRLRGNCCFYGRMTWCSSMSSSHWRCSIDLGGNWQWYLKLLYLGDEKNRYHSIIYSYILGMPRQTGKVTPFGQSFGRRQRHHLSKNQSISFLDKDSTIVTNETFRGKIYVADFIFLSCPTICPKMNKELKRFTMFTIAMPKSIIFRIRSIPSAIVSQL
jgi:hypothetical protein